MITPTAEKEALASKNDVSPTRVRRICFVCTGNTCRSPMAEAVTNAIAHEKGIPVQAVSAGLFANEGEPIAANAVLALERAGISPLPPRDYHRHTAHTITPEEAERADLLVGLTGGHAMELMMMFPALAGRITCMDPSVSDPWCGDLARYERCLAEIIDGVKRQIGADEI